ncbi:MAG: hypothetical protein WC310_01500 [Patescibacteria group bacterium]|jgi:hypothetical protein
MRHFLEKILLIGILIFLVFFGVRLFFLDFTPDHTSWGVSFDPYYAEDLGLDPQKIYVDILNDLKVDHIRLTAVWNKIETQKDVYDWTTLDWQVKSAKQSGAKILLTIGRKLPRWPECYQPDWWSDLSKEDREKELLEIIRLAVERYRDYDNVIAWQVENEPLVGWFGVCPAPDKTELKKEVALVRSLDSRQVVVSDSGELSSWIPTAKIADVLGTTMYRVVWNEKTGFWRWPIPASYYYYKALAIKKITGVKDVIVTELQAEPWSNVPIQQYPLSQQYKSMDQEQFKSNLQYVRRAGFDTVYLWGAEWWYWMKEKNSVDGYWQEAKKLWE